jgi:DNA recombination protein RmuC
MSFFELFLIIALLLNFFGIIFIIYIQKSKTGQQNPYEVMMELQGVVDQKTLLFQDRLFAQLYQYNNTLTEGTSKTQAVITESLSKMKDSIYKITLDSLEQIQKNNQEEIKRINETTKSSFDLITDANSKKLTQIQEDIERRMNDNLNQNLRSFEEVSVKLGAINKSAENMISSTASIDRLNDIFGKGSVKFYGTFSEEYLQNLLEMHVNGLWSRQVQITGSLDKIDFCITFGDIKVGIDSKFPLDTYERYNNETNLELKPGLKKAYLRKVKEMGTEMSKKYGRAFDHLLIYLPSDAMYNEVASDRETLDSLNNLKVVPISPTTILTVIYAISIMRSKLLINEHASLIQANISKIEKGMYSFKEEYRKLGEKLGQAQQNYSNVNTYVGNIEQYVKDVKIFEQNEQKNQKMTIETQFEKLELAL